MKKKSTPQRARTSDPEIVRLGSLETALAFHLRKAQEASFAAFKRRAHRQQLRVGKYAILQILAENPGINQTMLSKASGRDKSTLTSTLRELEGAGLMARQKVRHDARVSALHLTAKGGAELQALKEHAQKHDARLNAIVGERRDEFLSLLRAIATQLNGASGAKR